MLADGKHVDGRVDLSRLADGVEGRAEGERVDYGGEHAHLVAFHTVEAARCTRESAEYIAAADYYRYLYAGVDYRFYLLCVSIQAVGVDAVSGTGGE